MVSSRGCCRLEDGLGLMRREARLSSDAGTLAASRAYSCDLVAHAGSCGRGRLLARQCSRHWAEPPAAAASSSLRYVGTSLAMRERSPAIDLRIVCTVSFATWLTSRPEDKPAVNRGLGGVRAAKACGYSALRHHAVRSLGLGMQHFRPPAPKDGSL